MLNTYSVMPCQNVREDPISSVCFLLLSVVSSSTLGAKYLGTMLSLEYSVWVYCFIMLELTSRTFRANLQSHVLCSIFSVQLPLLSTESFDLSARAGHIQYKGLHGCPELEL